MEQKRKRMPASKESMPDVLNYIETTLQQYELERKSIYHAMLMVEECIIQLSEHAQENGQIQISIKKKLGDIHIKLSAPGTKFDMEETADFYHNLDSAEMDHDTETAIRNIILHSFHDQLKYKNRGNWNTVVIHVEKNQRRFLWLTLGALLFSIVCGLLMKNFVPQSITERADTYFLSPLKTMFLAALKMVVGPVVFFSIVSCVSNFGNLKEFGKIGGKIMGFYLLTTIFAILVGLGAFFLCNPGDASLLQSVGTSQATVEQTNISILDTIVGIVPDNIVKPFLNADMLQIIFISILCGIAVGMIGDYSRPLQEFFEACNTLFLKITTLIIKLIPIAVFCSMTSLVMLTGTDTLLSLLGMLGTVILGLFCMIVIYCLFLLLSGLNPFIFLKKYAPAMLTTFSLSSSSAAMPVNMQACQDSLGVSSKVCSFSIPLGATINMDGSCVYLVVAGLFLAKVYGIELAGSELISMMFSILVLSVGAPGIPGSALVCLSVLLVQIGIPVEAVGLIMGIDSILSMFRTMSNTTGDVAVTTIVAKSEHLLDLTKYNL